MRHSKRTSWLTFETSLTFRPDIPGQIEQMVLEQFIIPLVNATKDDSSSQEAPRSVNPGLRILSRHQDTKLATFDSTNETFVLNSALDPDSDVKPKLISLATKTDALCTPSRLMYF